MRNNVLILTSLSIMAGTSHAAMEIFSAGHGDIGIAYEAGEWEPHFHNEETDMELEPGEVIFHGSETNNPNFKLQVPGSGPFTFLGNPGDDVYIFPQVEEVGLPFLGIATEEIDPADFVGDITLTLSGFAGPGNLFLYQNDGIGNPTIFFDTTDGVSGADELTMSIGSHAHFNYAFTEVGIYDVTLIASGILNDGLNTFSQSNPATYTFGVNAVPEPSTYALLAGVVTLTGVILMRSRRSGQPRK